MKYSPAQAAQLLFSALQKAQDEAAEQQIVSAFMSSLRKTGSEAQGAAIIAELERLMEKADTILRPVVTTATPLSNEQCDALIAQLKEQHGVTDVHLDQRVDPTVLGGISIKIDDMLYDDTIKKKLHTLNKTLTQ